MRTSLRSEHAIETTRPDTEKRNANELAMKTMKVMRFNDPPDDGGLESRTWSPVPQPNLGEILIRVHAAGVTPTESQWYPTTHTRDGEPRSGAIRVMNSPVSSRRWRRTWIRIRRAQSLRNERLVRGRGYRRVLHQRVDFRRGQALPPKPPEAASVPIGALTAWQGLLIVPGCKRRAYPGARGIRRGGSVCHPTGPTGTART